MTWKHELKNLAKRITPGFVWKPLWFFIEAVRDLLHPIAIIPRRVMRSVQRSRKDRILGIYHLYEQQGAFGDMLCFLEILNVLRSRHNAEKVDVCYVDDPRSPHFTNHRYYDDPHLKRELLSLHRLLPNLGAVHTFDSEEQFESYYRHTYDRHIPFPCYGKYHSWPSRINYANITKFAKTRKKYLPIVTAFYHDHLFIPCLSVPQETLQWANDFKANHARNSDMIVVQLRKSDEFYTDRNSPIDVWKGFFQFYAKDNDVTFVVIGFNSEVNNEVRTCPNVLYSKDFHTNLEQDLALIQVSYLSLFPNSGMSVYSWFTGVPSLVFGSIPGYAQDDIMIGLKDYNKLDFMNPHQKMFWGPYTTDDIIREYELLRKELKEISHD